MSRPPSRSSTLLAFWAVRNVSLTPFSQVTCAEASPAAPLWVSCDLAPWCLIFSEEVRVCAVAHVSLDPSPWKVTFLTTS